MRPISLFARSIYKRSGANSDENPAQTIYLSDLACNLLRIAISILHIAMAVSREALLLQARAATRSALLVVSWSL
jgi:hypothetical protein